MADVERLDYRGWAERRFPEEEVRRTIFAALGEVIAAVHSRNSAVWALSMCEVRTLRLNVGGVEVFNSGDPNPRRHGNDRRRAGAVRWLPC